MGPTATVWWSSAGASGVWTPSGDLRGAPSEIRLADRRNFQLFHPLGYLLTTGAGA
jgi:hypothetical protein